MGMIDVTRKVFTNMTVWPGDESVGFERVSSISGGDAANVSRLHTGVHAGTHVDAPLHFINGGKSVDELDIRLFVGRALVVDMKEGKSIGKKQLTEIPLEMGEAVFFKTSASRRSLAEPFDVEYPGLTLDAAIYLVERGVRVIGTDALSVERYESKGHPVHKHLLENEILLIEGLCFRTVPPGRYRYTCMPLLLKGADGAPARVVLFDD